MRPEVLQNKHYNKISGDLPRICESLFIGQRIKIFAASPESLLKVWAKEYQSTSLDHSLFLRIETVVSTKYYRLQATEIISVPLQGT